jgi:hypothetical protein
MVLFIKGRCESNVCRVKRANNMSSSYRRSRREPLKKNMRYGMAITSFDMQIKSKDMAKLLSQVSLTKHVTL